MRVVFPRALVRYVITQEAPEAATLTRMTETVRQLARPE
jgi:hypothetical protein